MRFLQALSSTDALSGSDQLPEGKISQLQELAAVRRIEARHLLGDLRYATSWVTEFRNLAGRVDPGLGKSLNEFLTLPHLQDVRNMRVHDIEYYKGKGNGQERFLYQRLDDEGNVKFTSDGTSVYREGDRVWIGGRFDLNNAITVAKSTCLTLKQCDIFELMRKVDPRF